MKQQSQRIAFAATSDLCFDQRMQRVCNAYCEKGFSVELVGRVLPHSPPLSPQAFSQYRFNCFFTRGKSFYLEYNLRLFLRLLRTRPNAIWAADLDTLAAATLAAWLTGSVLVYDAHEYFSETPELKGRPFAKKIWETLARWAIPRANYAVTVSKTLAEILEARYKRPFLTIRNVPEWKLQPYPAAWTNLPILLYQGVLNAGRGLETAILAMHELPDMKLWLIGEGDLSESLRALVDREKLQERVMFLGRMLPGMLVKLTPQAFVGINLLESDSKSYYCSLANKTFDYVQAGLPAVHMDFPEYRNLNAEWECFVLLKELRADFLAEKIRELRDDRQYYERLARNCVQAAQEWNWEKEKTGLPSLFSTNAD